MHPTVRAGLSGLAGLALALSPAVVSGSPATARTPHPDAPRMSHQHAQRVLDHARDVVHDRAGARDRATGDDATVALRDLLAARPSLTAAERTSADRILARPSDPGATGALVYPKTAQLAVSCTAHFCVHWDTNPTDADRTTPTDVDATKQVLEHVWSVEVGTLGYRAPLADHGAPGNVGNPDARLDVFLGNIGAQQLYGYSTSDHPASKARWQSLYLVLDNDYAEFTGSRLGNLQVTVAHEFFHAVQAAYDFLDDVWLLEGSAAWMENVVYDGVNGYRQFLSSSAIRRPGVPMDTDDQQLGPYGTVLWFLHLQETLHGPAVVRQIWELAASPDGVSGGRYSLQAVTAALSARGLAFAPTFARYAEWNTLPRGSYSERALYPAPARWHSLTLGHGVTGTGLLGTDLRHLSSASLRLAPTSDVPQWRTLRIHLDLPDTSHGSTAMVQVRRRDGAPDRVMRVPLDGHGNATVVAGFDPAKVWSVWVTMTNASPAMRGCGSGSPYACGGYGVDDADQRYSVRASLA